MGGLWEKSSANNKKSPDIGRLTDDLPEHHDLALETTTLAGRTKRPFNS